MRHPTFAVIRKIALILLLGFIVVSPLIHLRTVAHLIPARFSDLYAPWFGTRAALHGDDPYSARVTDQIQTFLYGQPLQAGSTYDKEAFVYPATTVVLLAPFAWFPWIVVRWIFTLSGPLLVAFIAWIWTRICGAVLTRRRMTVLLLLVSCSWPAVWGYRVQQPTILVLELASLACFLLQREYPIWAGVLLALSTIKPQVVAPLIAWLLVIAVIRRQWRFIAAFVGSMALLVIGAEALVPGWLTRWYLAAVSYGHERARRSLLTLVFPRMAGLAVMAALTLCVCWALYRLHRMSRPASFGASAALVLAFTGCVIPTSLWMAFNVLLLVPAIVLFYGRRWEMDDPVIDFSLAAASFEVLAVPFCVLMSAGVGYRVFLAWFPFFGAFLPLVILPLLLVWSMKMAYRAQSCDSSFSES